MLRTLHFPPPPADAQDAVEAKLVKEFDMPNLGLPAEDDDDKHSHER